MTASMKKTECKFQHHTNKDGCRYQKFNLKNCMIICMIIMLICILKINFFHFFYRMCKYIFLFKLYKICMMKSILLFFFFFCFCMILFKKKRQFFSLYFYCTKKKHIFLLIFIFYTNFIL